MANVYPLGSQNYRKQPKGDPSGADPGDIVVDTGEQAGGPEFDSDSGTTQIPLPDGTLQITIGTPKPAKKESSGDFDENLAELLTEAELSAIAEKLLLGIEQDSNSRSTWLENMSNGISLLGLEVKNPRGAAAGTGASPQEGTSVVDHPLLLEAVLRFQANAQGELLPTDGPVKVRVDGEGNTLSSRLADALEKDMNYFLTKVAKEYYPDTDRMLLQLGFCGIAFKKAYHDPIKRRPVISSIDAKDLIISDAASDIDTAGRVTHRIKMRPSLIKRMQLVGAYRDVHLPQIGSVQQIQNPVDSKIAQVQGIAPPSYSEPEDQDRDFYECYCEIDIPGFEHQMDGEDTGLPLPYKVTIDKESRLIVQIQRNWEEDDEFCLPRNRIVAYIFIPGLGFYGIGLLNILGNATKAVTAAWRLMIDAGMFSNFPGFLYLRQLGKQMTNNFRVAPGTGQPIETPAIGGDIRSMIMPLPYKDPSAVFIQLIENISTTAQRVGGTAEMQVGEGKQDAPVGTTLAMIEQATKLMSSVHKRLHRSQAVEFGMLKELLMEDPEALWRHNKKSKVLAQLIHEAGQQPLADAQQQAADRHRQMFLLALNECDLIPRADPNTSSQTERYLKVVAMRQMAQTNPSIDMNMVDQRAFQVMGIDDGQSMFKPPPPPGTMSPSPEEMTGQATMMAAQARMLEANTKAQDATIKAQTDQQMLASKERIASLGVSRELVIHQGDEEREQQRLDNESAHRTADRAVDAAGVLQQAADSAASMRQQAADRAMDARQQSMDRYNDNQQRSADRLHKLSLARLTAQQGVADRSHQTMMEGLGRHADAMEAGLGRQHEAIQGALDRRHELAVAAAQPKPQGVAP